MGKAVGFFTDTTLCIGCKACEVACKVWNGLPAEGFTFTGLSYDNTGELSATSLRHVKFIEQFSEDRGQGRWLMQADCCKHCAQAGCLEACPTGAIIRTEYGSVYIQEDVCNGCRYCIAACPFGVIGLNERTGTVGKCTLCYDRLQVGMVPACAKACPTASIQFGEVDELRAKAAMRVRDLRARGKTGAYLYGHDLLGGLNVFYLLVDAPSVYGLPERPELPQQRVFADSVLTADTAALIGLVLLLALI
jgi:formate dehydrogenase iron-sulfur subunit